MKILKMVYSLSLFLDINFINRYYFLTLYIEIRYFLDNKQEKFNLIF